MARVTYTDWTIPVAQIGSRAGQSMEIDKAFPAPGGIGDTIVGVTEGSDVQVRGRFDSIVDGLIFTGSFTAPVHAVCTRCDTPLDRDWTAQATAFFPFEEQPEDVYPLIDRGAFADIEALIRDTFVDALPLQPLCRPDCKGLCPQCGVDLNEHPEHEHKMADMRFAGLAALKEQLEAEEQGDA